MSDRIEKHVELNAPVSRVWRALTDYREFGAWFQARRTPPGDPTRLALVGRLCEGSPRSIAQLSEGQPLTRQAISKHLCVLEGARLVRC